MNQYIEVVKALTPTQWAFYGLSVMALFGALGTIMSKNPIHSVIYLILTFFSLSAHYVMLNAQFLAAVNIIVYAGAIMVLFIFVIMFLNLREESTELNRNTVLIVATVLGSLLGLILISSLKKAEVQYLNPESFRSQTGMIETLGNVLYQDYLLPFELVSVLFLIAMAGAVMLGKREKGERNF
ncbi:NADH-quinone oxidoreductase subunit J [Emticicia sp. CRIBPO]|jgi:NADH-quinone oxidoreductase subunit J|uniref:NADH-quinone oxidoreductase subunit J family protein n=1 Tax=Emticicia sp. CRIBPO TaxID=2683258 RepID=UPI001412EDE6|nr:NADH-quinone oxidoreductase subunit J [Emticicia sp. CRIBPO]NBA88241.1 NADH-quinone oxidoreductase subunit J [Emticicia sp. CRIBPO]